MAARKFHEKGRIQRAASKSSFFGAFRACFSFRRPLKTLRRDLGGAEREVLKRGEARAPSAAPAAAPAPGASGESPRDAVGVVARSG